MFAGGGKAWMNPDEKIDRHEKAYALHKDLQSSAPQQTLSLSGVLHPDGGARIASLPAALGRLSSGLCVGNSALAACGPADSGTVSRKLFMRMELGDSRTVSLPAVSSRTSSVRRSSAACAVAPTRPLAERCTIPALERSEPLADARCDMLACGMSAPPAKRSMPLTDVRCGVDSILAVPPPDSEHEKRSASERPRCAGEPAPAGTGSAGRLQPSSPLRIAACCCDSFANSGDARGDALAAHASEPGAPLVLTARRRIIVGTNGGCGGEGASGGYPPPPPPARRCCGPGRVVDAAAGAPRVHSASTSYIGEVAAAAGFACAGGCVAVASAEVSPLKSARAGPRRELRAKPRPPSGPGHPDGCCCGDACRTGEATCRPPLPPPPPLPSLPLRLCSGAGSRALMLALPSVPLSECAIMRRDG
eukprot:363974-Chlamydomonas_euryale.AAC.20